MGWRAPLRSLARAGPWRPGGVEEEIWTLAPPAGATGHDRPSAERAVAPARLGRDAPAAGRRGHPAARVSAIAGEMAFSALTGAHAPGPVVVQVGHGGRSYGSSRHAHPARGQHASADLPPRVPSRPAGLTGGIEGSIGSPSASEPSVGDPRRPGTLPPRYPGRRLPRSYPSLGFSHALESRPLPGGRSTPRPSAGPVSASATIAGGGLR